MIERKADRARNLQARPTGGVASVIGRRTGRVVPKVEVAEYFGSDEDTPIMELLKACKPISQSFRAGDKVHVSDVIGKCVRKLALMKRMNIRHPQESIMEGRAITFKIGEALHDYVKSRFVSGHPDRVYAQWKCKCEATEHTGTFASRPTPTCPKCETPVAEQNEVSFVYEEYSLKGTPDVVLWMDEYGAYYIVEIKSMAGGPWAELARPLPDHKVQVALYWHILKSQGLPVVNKVSVLYVNKEFSFKYPYKEFMFDPTTVDISPYIDDLVSLKEANAGGKLPPRLTCGSNAAPEAKKCSVCVSCFSLNE